MAEDTPEKDAPAPAPADAAAAAATPAAAGEAPKKPRPEKKPEGPFTREAWDAPLAAAARERFGDAVASAIEYQKELTIVVAAAQIIDVLRWLKTERGFDYLVDLTALDFQARVPRFEVVYQLHAHSRNERLRVKTRIADGEEVPSATAVWIAANWPEREVWDMFGLYFSGHPGLERILTWEGFNGHPLRKDFPVQGIDTGAAIYDDIPPSTN